MLRFCVFLSLIIVISAFTPHMCDPLPTDGGRKIVPIVCKPRLKLRDMSGSSCASSMRKLVYEATFENDRIVIRPRRRRLKRGVWEKLKRVWRDLREDLRGALYFLTR